MTEETRQQLDIAGNYHVPLVNNPDMNEYTTIVDAIFGVGLSRTVEGHCRDVICQMNEASAWKVAVDIPSGVNGAYRNGTGNCFLCRPDGNLRFLQSWALPLSWQEAGGESCNRGYRHLPGQYRECPHFPSGNSGRQKIEDLLFLREREPDGNKGTFGKVLAVAGSPGMCGAAYLCSEGAFQTGAGMVRIRTAGENRILFRPGFRRPCFPKRTEILFP